MQLKLILTLAAILTLPLGLTHCASTGEEDTAADVDDIMVDVSDALPGLGPGPSVNDRGVEANEEFY